ARTPQESPQAPSPAPPATQAGARQGGRPLTLDEALEMAERSSEQIAIAQAGVDRADSAERRAKSDLLPQVNVSGAYARTLRSECADVFRAGRSGTPLQVTPNSPIDARVAEIERALQQCPPSPFGGPSSSGSSSSSSSSSSNNTLPFGQANAYRLNFQVVQNV